MIPQEFVAKWKKSTLSERSASQQHFLDLCEMLDEPKPATVDPDGTEYTFERGVSKTDGGKGWADVWKRHYFAWEYKGKHKNLQEAYQQLLRYREDLESPPLMVVCDMDRFEVHTNFTDSVKTIYAFDLDSLDEPKNLDVLRKVFRHPDALKPQQTPKDITEQVAKRFAKLADGMRSRNIHADQAAHFLMKLMFCMFAEGIEILEGKVFSKILASSGTNAAKLSTKLRVLFQAMSKGGDFGAETIRWFNGGLFEDADVIDLIPDEIDDLIRANECDWSNVEPSIFGTLFERTLDPDKRSQIGAHYTGMDDILMLLEPVLMAPLRREWEEAKANADKAWGKLQADLIKRKREAIKRGPMQNAKARKVFETILLDFLHKLNQVKILDPACGSGNFLYVAIKLLLDLEKEVISYGSRFDFTWRPHCEPTQLLGIEINPYAQQLAQIVIWIGYLQWLRQNGFGFPDEPILKPFENIKHMDAIIDLTDPANPKEPEWPEADFIVGNPPFLGGKRMRAELGDDYVEALFPLWTDRVPHEADLCCYWFEKARQQVAEGNVSRAGLLATQGIRGGANREVIKRIKEYGDIFFTVSDRDWILDGAAVHVSMIGFDNGSEKSRVRDGEKVPRINADLSSNADITTSALLQSNANIAFMGTSKGGLFEIAESIAMEMLSQPNPHGKPNSDVVVPWVNGMDLTGARRWFWIIDFGVGMTEIDASCFEKPFEHVKEHIRGIRETNKRQTYSRLWWQHVEARPAMRKALSDNSRFLCTPRVSKFRFFIWLAQPTLPDSATFAFAKSDDFFMGLLHSRAHEVWARSQGTQVRDRESGFRYTPRTCFETYPFPIPTDSQREAVAQAAKELDTLRNNWLNPPEWTKEEILEFPGSADGPWKRYVQEADARGIGKVRYPRIVAKDTFCALTLKKRTLTNLYNQRPTWLDLAHKKLDAAVFAAYGWDASMSDEELLAKLLELNLQRAAQHSDARGLRE